MKRPFRQPVFSCLLVLFLTMGSGAVAAGSQRASTQRFQTSDLGIFGLSESDWEANGFLPQGQTSDGFVEYTLEGSDDSVYYIGFDGGVTVLLERMFVDSLKQFGSVQDFVESNYLPTDYQFLDEYTAVLVDNSGDWIVVELYYSESVYQQTGSRSGVVLVTYAGPDASSVERVSISLGT